MTKNDLITYFGAFSNAPVLDRSIQTLEYMLQRNSYNKDQEEALKLALDTFRLIHNIK